MFLFFFFVVLVLIVVLALVLCLSLLLIFRRREKTECGSAFTSKLEGMFKDIDLSRDLMSTYSHHLKAKLDDRTVFKLDKSREMDLHVQVLTTGYWPAYPSTEVGMPEEMQEHVECFK